MIDYVMTQKVALECGGVVVVVSLDPKTTLPKRVSGAISKKKIRDYS
jgi:hypothetical protein